METIYRHLTPSEISALEARGCSAEDWEGVFVTDEFNPSFVRNTVFYGTVKLGAFRDSIEVTDGFFKHSGVYNAALRNVTVGNDTLIDRVGNFINNYDIGNHCFISNVSTVETTSKATFGEGTLIAVLNEMGDGNVTIFEGLTSQIAALMVKYNRDKEFTSALSRLIEKHIEENVPKRGTIGDGVRILNTTEITNTHISEGCSIVGACRLSDCSIKATAKAPVYIGSGVIVENSIISGGSKITNSVKLENCFVGEACEIANGFTAASSVFFANCFMANGEACAAFCGPFTASHHKSSLLIGSMFSFYNAGSSTNFSNHAYKMGPLHYGILERGTKTASGAYILMPANIGAFSVCFGKLMHHPDTRNLPFSYLIAYGETMYLVPGKNIGTVGLYRDVRKWPKRDKRKEGAKRSAVNFAWLSPFTIGEILRGKKILEDLRNASGDGVSTYNYHEYVINNHSLVRGIRYYNLAIKMYIGHYLAKNSPLKPEGEEGLGEWTDLGGMLLPLSQEKKIVKGVISGEIKSTCELSDMISKADASYKEWCWQWTHSLIREYYGLEEITPDDVNRILEDCSNAKKEWISEIRSDMEKEYSLGDIDPEVRESFSSQLDADLEGTSL